MTCKIRIMLLSIGRLCCIFGVSWDLLVTILGASGVHFGSPNRLFRIPGRPLARRYNQSRRRSQEGVPQVTELVHFGSHCGFIFLRFVGLCFGTFFGSLLKPFWPNFGSQNRTKINKTSIQNSIEISMRLLIRSWTFLDQFWEYCGPWALKNGALVEARCYFWENHVF